MPEPTDRTEHATPPHRWIDTISRRATLGTLGAAGAAALLAACGGSGDAGSAATTTSTTSASESSTTPSSAASSTTAAASTVACVLTKEQEQGPYWYPAAKVRSDITDGKDGVPMDLAITVVDATTCKPIANAGVDVWTADALGEYSDTQTGLFLRGIQITGADGVARFTTIFPGWYPARTNHVHVKVHIGGQASSTYTGGHVSHTGNLFFPEDVSLAVAKVAPYTDNTAQRVTLTDDFVYKGQNGSGSMMTLKAVDGATPAKGYTAAMTVGIDPDDTPTGIGIAGTVS